MEEEYFEEHEDLRQAHYEKLAKQVNSIIDAQMYEDMAQVPTFVQEFGSIGYLSCSRKVEVMDDVTNTMG